MPATSSILIRVLAVVLPLGIVASALATIGGMEPSRDDEFHVLAEERIPRMQGRVVIFGNSLARRNVKPKVLSEALGLPKPAMHLTEPNTGGPFWYAALKNRIVPAPRPRVLVVVSDLTSLLLDAPRSDDTHRLLMAELPEDDPVFAEKVFDGRSPTWLRLTYHRTVLREAFLDRVRDVGAGLVFHPLSPLKRGRGLGKTATERVFEPENLDFSLHQRMVPTAQAVTETDADAVLTVEDSVLPEILAVARDADLRLVFVRAPLAPGNERDVHPLSLEREVVEAFNENGLGYLDLRSLDLRDRHFGDPRHMSPEGGRIFSEALAEALVGMGALEEGPLPPAPLPVVPSEILRTGEPLPLPELGPAVPIADCTYKAPVKGLEALSAPRLSDLGLRGASPILVTLDGAPLLPWEDTLVGCLSAGRLDANAAVASLDWDRTPALGLTHAASVPLQTDDGPRYWVYPGTSLTVRFDEAWSGSPAQFGVRVVAESFGKGRAPTVSVGDTRWQLPGSRRHTAQLSPDVPTEPWEVTITAPADGAYVLVQGLVVGQGPGRSLVIGSAADNYGAATRLLGGMKGLATTPTYENPPVALEIGGKPRSGGGRLAAFRSREIAYLSDTETWVRSPYPQRCSPLEVTEQGIPLPLHNRSCGEVKNKGLGRVCHDGPVVAFSAPDGSKPLRNGRTYALGLKEDRRCARTWWLYPSDQMRVAAAPEELDAFRDGVSTVEVEVFPYLDTPGPWEVRIRLLVEGRVYLEETLSGTEAMLTTQQWTLSERIPPGSRDVVLALDNPSDAFFQVVTAALSEAGELAEAPRLGADDGSLSVVRRGSPPVLPPPEKFVRLTTPCGYRKRIGLKHISDNVLNDLGIGRGSPVVLTEDGAPMRAHANAEAFSMRCAGAFGHTGRYLWFSPTDDPEAGVSRTYRHQLTDAVPWHRADGEPIYWVYPGTALEITLPPESTRVALTLQSVRGENDAGRAPEVQGFGQRQEADRDRFVATLEATGEAPERVLAVSSPEDGPYVVITELVVDGTQLIALPEVRPWEEEL